MKHSVVVLVVVMFTIAERLVCRSLKQGYIVLYSEWCTCLVDVSKTCAILLANHVVS